MTEFWTVFIKPVLNWLNGLDNHLLDVIVNLLTILVIVVGLTNWIVKKITKKKRDKSENGNVIDTVSKAQKSFRTVDMLENPTKTGEKIGDMVDIISHEIGGKKMSKFFKWLWYNKEQMFSILYNVLLLVLSQIATFAGLIEVIFPTLAGTGLIIVKVIICVVSVAFTALTVRNVCVKYGLSSLDTIDTVLAERAAEAAKKLSPEQRKAIKANISTLQEVLNNTVAKLTEQKEALIKITALYEADPNLVHDFEGKKAVYVSNIAEYEKVKANVEAKINAYKTALNGVKTEGNVVAGSDNAQ